MRLLTFLFIFIGLYKFSWTQDRIFLFSRQSFAADMFKNLSRPESFVISPASIDFALSALFFGSSQQTFMEMLTGLHFSRNYSMNMIQNNFMLLNRNLKGVNGLEIATKIYVNVTLMPLQSYKNTIQRVLNAEIESINFAKNVEAAQRINSYVAEKTHNMIKDIISSDSVDAGVTMILLNCIYFKGSWQYKFPKNKTYDGKFYIDEINTVPVQFMTQKSEFMFGGIEEFNWASILSLPYANSDMTMLFVLPRQIHELPELINNMTNFDWSTVDSRMYPTQVIVTIPKFNASFEQRIEGNLKNMGFQTIFDNKISNLDRILTSSTKNLNLYVDSVIHKAIIKVDEDGTEAAAVTMSMTRSMDMEFEANHPFLFMLRAKSSILFIGQFTGDVSKPFVTVSQFLTSPIPGFKLSDMLNQD